jgi:hypothetical protein
MLKKTGFMLTPWKFGCANLRAATATSSGGAENMLTSRKSGTIDTG